jgi:hypothetical protein
MAVCQVAIRKSLIQSMWHDQRCREHFRKFPEDPLRIPFNDPPPEVQHFICPVQILCDMGVLTTLYYRSPSHFLRIIRGTRRSSAILSITTLFQPQLIHD